MSSYKKRRVKEGGRNRLKRQLNRIYKRDCGICHWCKLFVPRYLASRDHFPIPFALCTLEQARSDENMVLAHIKCNSLREPRRPARLTYKIGDLFNGQLPL